MTGFREMLIEAKEKAVAQKEEIEKLKEVLKELIDHTHACEKELTEDLYRLNFCGESSSLTNAREALKDKP